MAADIDRLVLAAAQGDAQAYTELVGETSSLVSSIALAVVRDLELSQDVAQEVFLAAWKDLKSLRNPASFLPWLRQMTRNRGKAALRSTVRRRKLGIPGLLDEMLPVIMDPRPTVMDQMIAKEELHALSEALSSLPEETREVLALFYREGQSVEQVASLLDLSEAAVRQRLSRARASLRVSLREEIGETLCRTAPGVAFTTAIIAALPAAAPPTAAAAGLTASKVSGSFFGLGLLKLLLPLSGVIAGAVGGVSGVLHRSWHLHKEAQDEQERRELRRHTWVSIAVVVLFAAACPLLWLWLHNTWSQVAWFVAYIASLAVLQHVWLPRIVRRRMEAEMLSDPEWAMARRRRERRQAILGWSLGIGMGSLGLAAGLWFVVR